MAKPIKRKLTSVNAPTMKRAAPTASLSGRPKGSKNAGKTGTAPSAAPASAKTPADKKFDNARAGVLKNRREGGKAKAGAKSAKERFDERLKQWEERVKKNETDSKLKRDCRAINVKIAADNRKKLIAHGDKCLEARLLKRKSNLAKTKPQFKDNKIVVPKLDKDARTVKLPAVPKTQRLKMVKGGKLVNRPAPVHKKKAGVDAGASRAQKAAEKAHTVEV